MVVAAPALSGNTSAGVAAKAIRRPALPKFQPDPRRPPRTLETRNVMTITTAEPTPTADRRVVADLPLWRLNLMRVGYAVMGVGLAAVKWPLVIGYDRSMPLYEGIVAVLLTAMSLLAFLGLRYPVRLLPILLFESLWKLIWLTVVALPAVVAGDVDAAMHQVIVNCSIVVIVFAVVPWRYVWQRYVVAKGDRWRRAAA
jgi:hypothetical protein